MPRKKVVFSLDDVKYTNRALPKSLKYSPSREIADKLIEKGGCVENLPDKNMAMRVAGYLRKEGRATRMAEVGGKWCVWNKGRYSL